MSTSPSTIDFFTDVNAEKTFEKTFDLSMSSSDFPFLLDTSAPFKQIIPAPFTIPSPPASIFSESHSIQSEGELDLPDITFDFNTPSSTTLISPKSSTSAPTLPFDEIPEASAAEALSNHHLQRYFHYKNLAAQAEAAASQQEQFDALLAYTMGDDRFTQPFYGQQPSQAFGLPYNAATQQQQAAAAAMHAQAQAHMQAHDLALARANQQRSLSMNYYLPSQRTVLETLPGQPMWSRQSVSSVASSPFPTQTAPIVKTTSSASLPNMISEGENELEDELNSPSPPAVANPHGGGRGYIPGKTPDDPKKKHKCSICGRGFARAFNLKSHVQTHNPARSKPHQCPHPSCKRGFSRLHDLERHRQGIHSDGPLVDAKRRGIPPAVARAQTRMTREDA